MNVFKKINKSLDVAADKLQETTAKKHRALLMDLTQSEGSFVRLCAGLPMRSLDEFRRYDDVLTVAADALSYFRRLDRLVADYEEVHGIGSAITGSLSLDDIADDFCGYTPKSDSRQSFDGWSEDICDAVKELTGKYSGFEIRNITGIYDPKENPEIFEKAELFERNRLKNSWGD